MIQSILLLGDPRLYEPSTPVSQADIPYLRGVVQDLHDTLMEFRRVHGCGRAIAAPQIGVRLRVLYQCIDTPIVFLNPVLEFPDEARMEVIDDCMSFPNLLVRVQRYRRCIIHFRDMEWKEQSIALENDLSELMQHEYDHLDGILATMRAMDDKALFIKQS